MSLVGGGLSHFWKHQFCSELLTVFKAAVVCVLKYLKQFKKHISLQMHFATYADYNKNWTKLIQGNKNHLAYR